MEVQSIVTVAGAKGGVGKTTTSINVGAAAAADGLRTVVVELDLAMANVLDFLSVPCDEEDPTLHEVLAGNADVSEAVYHLSENFAVAPSGTDLAGYSDVDFDRLPEVLDRLADTFDLVLVDTGAGLSNATVKPLSLADATVLVSTPRVAAIRDIEKTKQLAERVETPVCGLTLTKSGTGASPGPDRIADFLDVRLLGHVPDNEAIPASQDQGVPVIESAPGSEVAAKYRKIAGNLLFRLDTGVDSDGAAASDPTDEVASETEPDGQPVAAVDVDPEPVVRRIEESSHGGEEPSIGDGTTPETTDDNDTRDDREPISVVERRDETSHSAVEPEYPTPPVTKKPIADGSRKTEHPAGIASEAPMPDRPGQESKREDGSPDESIQNGDGEESGDKEETAEDSSVVSRFRSLVGL